MFNDLRSFVHYYQNTEDCVEIRGADWDKEIQAVTEATAELVPNPPMLLFDEIKGYPKGFRVLTLPLASHLRAAHAFGLPLDKTKLELVRLAAQKMTKANPVPPVEVDNGPVMENVLTGEEVDLFRFPSPLFHEQDGGRYIGTGDAVINRDPDSGYVNMGTYRIQVHAKDLLGLWISPGQQGRQILQKYWDKGESCPIVAAFGVDPLTFMASSTKKPWGYSELDFAGGLRERPLEVMKGPLTGLPIPAYAEIAIEGEVPPPNVESRNEGPFGEWTGYYSGGSQGTGEPQPVIRVKAIYHRNDPILHGSGPLWSRIPQYGLSHSSGILWSQLEAAGIQDIQGVFAHNRYMIVVSIKQKYPGHAKQAGLAVLGCAETARHGRHVVIVDEDIDPTDMQEVLWAMETRVDPAKDIDIISGGLSTPLDPIMSPEKRKSRDYTNSRAIYYAVRPFIWKDQFPKVSRSSPEMRRHMIEKYKGKVPFRL